MKRIILAGLAALFLAPLASAHTIAIGVVNTGGPGTATLWMGSYHTGAANEGSITLQGQTINFAGGMQSNQTLPPDGMVYGTDVFYSACANYQGCPGSTGDYSSATNPTGQTVTIWQGVTFTGLQAGTYQYQISGMNTVVWSDWNSGSANWTGMITITGQQVGVVPEPGTLALLGLGLAGVGFARRRRV